MSDKPKITKADMNKILNCQDQLQSTLAGLVNATKKFQDASDKIEKKAAGLPMANRGSDYYQKNHDKKALNAANLTIDKITKDYTVDIASIDKNIGVLRSQAIYQKRIKDLIDYYKKNISSDQKQIADEKSKRAVANRMSTFYNDNSDASKTVKKYTSYIYWGIFILALIMLIYNSIRGGISLTAITAPISGLVASTLDTTETVKQSDKKPGKVKNPLSKDQMAKITGGPNKKAKQSSVFATSGFVGGNKYSVQPWFSIVVTFATLPLIIEYILKPLQPYFIEFTLPRVGN